MGIFKKSKRHAAQKQSLEGLDCLQYVHELEEWCRRGFLGHSPQFIKERVLLSYSVAGAPWIETGTYLGTTTEFLIKHFPMVHTIEPHEKHYKNACQKFSEQNVKLYNDISENVLEGIVDSLEGDANFWLDGHYSFGDTFQGPSNCPVRRELEIIEANLNQFERISIFIDDVRCFVGEDRDLSYPPLDELVDWARAQGFSWFIEHDIFVMSK